MSLDLTESFETNEAEWLQRVDAVLKGADFEAVLTSRTSDGIRISPLYSKAAGKAPIIGRAPSAPWTILQRIDDPDPARANAQALIDLENGATGLQLVFASSVSAQGFGLRASEEAVTEALKGVYLDAGIEMVLDCGPRGRDAAHAFAEAAKSLGYPPNTIRVRFGLNPIGTGAMIGSFHGDAAQMAKNVATAVQDLSGQAFAGPFVAADGRVVHAAGGSEAQELGFVLSSALFYWRALEASGVALDEARAMIEFRLASDSDQFISLAKHRALRQLWASIEQQSGLSPQPIIITSETATRMLTVRDPHVNILRSGMGCFAAALGGANAISVVPFTSAIGLPDGFARRVARNTQLVMLEEAHLAKVSDPAAGAGGFEALTESLVVSAWKFFQLIEHEGGIVSAIQHGKMQHEIAKSREAYHDALLHKKATLIGVTKFPNPDEKPTSVLEPTLSVTKLTATSFEPLKAIRWAESFEAQSAGAYEGVSQ
jgi:methylmalonyl-CoA mutase